MATCCKKCNNCRKFCDSSNGGDGGVRTGEGVCLGVPMTCLRSLPDSRSVVSGFPESTANCISSNLSITLFAS